MLRALEVPLLVTHGRADTVVLPAMAEHVVDMCPTAEASWYDGVGHVPHLEEPERFNRELADLCAAPECGREAASDVRRGRHSRVGEGAPRHLSPRSNGAE